LSGFRVLTIQNRLHNEFFRPFLWPIFQYALMVVHVFLNYVLIKSNAWKFPVEFSLMLLLLQPMVLFFEKNCFETAAKLYDLSLQFQLELSQINNRYMQKVKNSLKPLRIEVGPCYFFKMCTFPTFVYTLVDYTISALLTFGWK